MLVLAPLKHPRTERSDQRPEKSRDYCGNRFHQHLPVTCFRKPANSYARAFVEGGPRSSDFGISFVSLTCTDLVRFGRSWI